MKTIDLRMGLAIQYARGDRMVGDTVRDIEAPIRLAQSLTHFERCHLLAVLLTEALHTDTVKDRILAIIGK